MKLRSLCGPWTIPLFWPLVFILMAGSVTAQESRPVISDTSRAANADTVRSKMKSPTAALLRSLVFPGWGQWYNGKRFKAFLVFGAEAGLVANTVYQNQKVQASTSELEREFYLENRRLSNWWLAGVILYSMIDAFVDAHLSDFDESPDLSSLAGRHACALTAAGSGKSWNDAASICLWRVQFAL